MQQHAFRLFADSSVKRFRCLTVLRTLPLFGRTAAIKMKVLAFAQAFFSCPSRVVKQVCELSSKFDCQDAGLRDVSYLQIACFEELRFNDVRKHCTTRGSTKLRPVAWFGASSNARLRFVCLVNDWALAKFVNPQRPGFQCRGRLEDKNLALVVLLVCLSPSSRPYCGVSKAAGSETGDSRRLAIVRVAAWPQQCTRANTFC